MDEFEGTKPLPGLAHLGRHIRDKNGAPSGSPANFENLRGVVDPTAIIPTQDDIASAEAVLSAELQGAVTTPTQEPTPN